MEQQNITTFLTKQGNNLVRSFKIKYENGDEYEGDIFCYKRHGYGTMNYNDGRIYKGNWFDNTRHGFGGMQYNNGTIYEGYWFAGIRNGEGKEIKINGEIILGYWADGELDEKTPVKKRKIEIKKTSPSDNQCDYNENYSHNNTPSCIDGCNTPHGSAFITYPLHGNVFFKYPQQGCFGSNTTRGSLNNPQSCNTTQDGFSFGSNTTQDGFSFGSNTTQDGFSFGR